MGIAEVDRLKYINGYDIKIINGENRDKVALDYFTNKKQDIYN